MTKLNRSQPFGTITPPMLEGAMDRPAHYEQDGNLYDAHDQLIVLGEPLVAEPPTAPEKPAAPVKEAKAAAAPKATKAAPKALTPEAPKAPETAKEPTAESAPAPAERPLTAIEVLNGNLPFAAFKKEAKRILGDQCPASKGDIKAALAAFDAQPNLKAQRQEETAAAQNDAGKNGVDLAAWGRGQKIYLFGEVRKAIKTRFNVVVTEEWDAVDLLINEKVITAREARPTNANAA